MPHELSHRSLIIFFGHCGPFTPGCARGEVTFSHCRAGREDLIPSGLVGQIRYRLDSIGSGGLGEGCGLVDGVVNQNGGWL